MIYVLLTIIGIPAIFLVMFFKMKRRQEEKERINMIRSIEKGRICRVMYLGDIRKAQVLNIARLKQEAEIIFTDETFHRKLIVKFKDFVSVG